MYIPVAKYITDSKAVHVLSYDIKPHTNKLMLYLQKRKLELKLIFFNFQRSGQ